MLSSLVLGQLLDHLLQVALPRKEARDSTSRLELLKLSVHESIAHLNRGWDQHLEVAWVLLDESGLTKFVFQFKQDILDEVQAEDPVDNELSLESVSLFDHIEDFTKGTGLVVLLLEVKHDVLVEIFQSLSQIRKGFLHFLVSCKNTMLRWMVVWIDTPEVVKVDTTCDHDTCTTAEVKDFFDVTPTDHETSMEHA